MQWHGKSVRIGMVHCTACSKADRRSKVIPCFETQLDYVIQAAKKIQSDRIRAIEVKQDITTALNKYIDTWHEGGVWSGECKSWYKNNTKGGKIMCWGCSVSWSLCRC